MEFFTKIAKKALSLRINHSKKGLMLGSCFAESIAQRMIDSKFPIIKNPFGVLYNPASIAAALGRLESGEIFSERDLFQNGDLWGSFAHHGSFSSVNPDKTLEKVNFALKQGAVALAQSDYVVITFGSAWLYRLACGGDVVANCHKFPASHFTRERMSATEIVELYKPILSNRLSGKKVVFTISPIRHIKDGLAENCLSKATLRVAIDELVRCCENAEYFPSFEVMMDELRDYRFYKDDMVHPTDQAVDYIWEFFQASAMDEPTRSLSAKIEEIKRAASHRPLKPQSAAHEVFRNKIITQIGELTAQHNDLDFTQELKQLGA